MEILNSQAYDSSDNTDNVDTVVNLTGWVFNDRAEPHFPIRILNPPMECTSPFSPHESHRY